MPTCKILISAQLDNVTNLQTPGDDYQYSIKTKCNGCHEVSEKWQVVSGDEETDLPGSRGKANFVTKCKMCKKVNNLDVCLSTKKMYTADDTPGFSEIITFECRGLSVVDFRFGDGWKCIGVDSGVEFANLDLSQEWYEYDEEANCPVSISDLKYKIV
ncbi:CXXC motif containing zinc binding protein [Oratosquilla oratoria]|uniref:CXXC motif containing zinc binding protein n=1 Tax=Oratosquilla oratoria TaxID=337810 RepID=UPI003F76D5BA